MSHTEFYVFIHIQILALKNNAHIKTWFKGLISHYVCLVTIKQSNVHVVVEI